MSAPTGAVVLAAALAGVAGLVAMVGPSATSRVAGWGPLGGPTRRVGDDAWRSRGGGGRRGAADGRPPATDAPGARLAACALAGVGAALLVGGAVGAVLGGAVAVGGPRLLARLEPAAVRRRRLRVARDLPVAADLLAACLVAGSAPEAALGAVGPAVGGPVGAALESVLVALQLGADPRAAWAPFARDPDLGPLARAVARALDSGAPLAAVVERCAEDLRQRRRSSAEVAARAVAVRAAAPLGLCFLPAFVLLGVVPTVLGLARGVLG